MRSHVRFWLVFAVLAVGLGGAGWYYAKGATYRGPSTDALGSVPANGLEGGAPQAATGAPARGPVTVEAKRVIVDTVIEDLQAVGTLRANEAVIVAPEIAGRVVQIAFKEGDAVKAGDVLVKLDDSVLAAELAKARSDLTLARANHERAIKLAGQGMGTIRARDEARGAFEAAQANLALAEARLKKATIRAPLSGVLGLRSVSVGAYVAPGERIVELADIDPIKLDFRVPELALTALRRGQTVNVTVDALPGRTFEGEIYAIDPIVDVAGRAIRLRAHIPNAEGALSPGLFARVRLVVERRPDAILVPEAAVFGREGQQFVYRVVDDRAALTRVVLGKRRPGQVEIREGLQAGDVVVTAGHQQVREGALLDVAMAGRGV